MKTNLRFEILDLDYLCSSFTKKYASSFTPLLEQSGKWGHDASRKKSQIFVFCVFLETNF